MNIMSSQTDRIIEVPLRIYNNSNKIVQNNLGTFNPNDPYETSNRTNDDDSI